MVAADREVDQQRRLFAEASTLRRSMNGWRALREPADWLTPRAQAKNDYESGRFLLTRLGAERYLDPEQVGSTRAAGSRRAPRTRRWRTASRRRATR